jgi:uncharacterized repeat protein (TIGR03943 family)
MMTIPSRLISAGTLMAWGSVLCYIYFSGRVASYLHPTFQPFTAAAGVVLVLMAAGLLVFSGSEEPRVVASDGPCGKPRGVAWDILSAVVLVVPLLTALRMSPGEFGAAAVLNRGFIENVADLPAMVARIPEPPLPGEEGLEEPAASYLVRNEEGRIMAEAIDLLYAAEEPTMRSDFENQEVEVIGQYMPARVNNPAGDRFNLVRMYVLCCAADARPMAVPVQGKIPETLPEMGWVKVKGKATFPVEGGRRAAVIVADQVEETEPPEETFIY